MNDCIREVYEPGNGDSYDFILVTDDRGARLFGWINAPGGGRLMQLPSNVVAGGYIAQKMGLDPELSKRDLEACLAWLHVRGLKVDLPKGRSWGPKRVSS